MPYDTASLPADCAPRAPAPAAARIERAAQAIYDALRSDRLGRPAEGERTVEAERACCGFPEPYVVAGDDADDYRWAVQEMVVAGLLTVVVEKMPPPEPDITPADENDWEGQIFLALMKSRTRTDIEAPRTLLRSTPLLWQRAREGNPILGSDSPKETKGKDIDARMRAIRKENPLSVDWTLKKWAEKLGCSRSTVCGTGAWKEIIKGRREKGREAAGRAERSRFAARRSN